MIETDLWMASPNLHRISFVRLAYRSKLHRIDFVRLGWFIRAAWKRHTRIITTTLGIHIDRDGFVNGFAKFASDHLRQTCLSQYTASDRLRQIRMIHPSCLKATYSNHYENIGSSYWSRRICEWLRQIRIGSSSSDLPIADDCIGSTSSNWKDSVSSSAYMCRGVCKEK